MSDTVKSLYEKVASAKKELREAIAASEPEPIEDWELRRADGSPVKLSSLFAPHRDMVLVHNMGRSCPYCTLWADGFRGIADHVRSRAAFVLASPDDPGVLDEFSRSRGWNFECVSWAGTGFGRALDMASAEGKPWPGVSGLSLHDDGSITRKAYAYFGPGDDFCAVWPMLDLLDGGAGGWAPKYSY